MAQHRADIGVFGGTGFYKFLDKVEEVWVETPYGAPSDRVGLAEVGGQKVAFLPRHGRDHRFPPHRVNYRANLWAMKELGVSRIISPCAAGSLQPHVKPGEFVILDQYVDRTSGRKDTFYDGPVVTHVSVADPYCPQLRAIAAEQARALGITVHDQGTVVVIQGPRFSTRSESRWFSAAGWEVINMTQYPEIQLARELDMCVVGVALITDFDCGLEGRSDIQPVTHEEVIKVFNANLANLQRLLFKLIEAIPGQRASECRCHETVRNGRFVG